jgi:hypothetical protein
MCPDRILFSEWNRLYDHLWNISADNHRFPQGNRFDNAVAVFFNQRELQPGKKLLYNTYYGLYGANVVTSDELLASVSAPAVAEEMPFLITLNVVNTSGRSIKNLDVTMKLPLQLTWLPTIRRRFIPSFRN